MGELLVLEDILETVKPGCFLWGLSQFTLIGGAWYDLVFNVSDQFVRDGMIFSVPIVSDITEMEYWSKMHSVRTFGMPDDELWFYDAGRYQGTFHVAARDSYSEVRSANERLRAVLNEITRRLESEPAYF